MGDIFAAPKWLTESEAEQTIVENTLIVRHELEKLKLATAIIEAKTSAEFPNARKKPWRRNPSAPRASEI